MNGDFIQIRDGKNQVIGYTRKDPKSGVTHIYDKNSVTIGWAKEPGTDGPGYTVMSKGNTRVAHSFAPEYLLGIHSASLNKENKKETPSSTSKPFKSMGTDGSDPRYL